MRGTQLENFDQWNPDAYNAPKQQPQQQQQQPFQQQIENPSSNNNFT